MTPVYDEDGSIITVARRDARDVRREGGLGRSRIKVLTDVCLTCRFGLEYVRKEWPLTVCCGRPMERMEV